MRFYVLWFDIIVFFIFWCKDNEFLLILASSLRKVVAVGVGFSLIQPARQVCPTAWDKNSVAVNLYNPPRPG
jgi:hypothetical protein